MTYVLRNGVKLIIRSAKPKDTNEIFCIMRKVHKESPYLLNTSEDFNFTEEQKGMFIKNQTLFLVAEVDGKVVGTATLKRNTIEKINHTAYFGVVLLKAYCCLGIGGFLTKETLAWGSANGIEKINLEVFEENKPALKLYKRLGFIIEGRKNRYIKMSGRYQDMIIMTKFLMK